MMTMDREGLKSFANRMMDNDRMRSLAERAGLYTAPQTSVSRELAMLAAGLGVGALIMYMLDPEQGRRRRTLARDQATSFMKDAERRIESKARDLSNRARGVVAEARSAVRQADQPF